jgi:hypothetical protein
LELKTQYQINAHFEFFFQHIWTQSLIWYIFSVECFYYLDSF